jgi:streptogramin lyase
LVRPRLDQLLNRRRVDGNLWFTERDNPGRIGRITPSGTITEFTTGLTSNSRPWGITAGPDGNLWFTEQNSPSRIGRITPSGTITEFSTGLSTNGLLSGITAGPDGNLWFTENNCRLRSGGSRRRARSPSSRRG